ncbi:MAG: hypothetical protein ACLSFA_07215 [Roseburia inulinivorans]
MSRQGSSGLCVWKWWHRMLRSANIEYVKWDMNRQLTDLGSADSSG